MDEAYDIRFRDFSQRSSHPIPYFNPRLKGKTYVVSGGVDALKADVYAKVPKKKQICFVGRMVRDKNPIDAVRACLAISRESPDMQFVFVGGGPLLGQAMKLATHDSSIRFLGDLSEEKFRILAESTLVIGPSLKEGLPLVPLEALACGTPFVAYDIPGMREVEAETGGGILVETNFQSLAEACIRLLRAPDEIQALAQRGKKKVRERFSWEELASRLEAVLLKVCLAHGRKA